MYTAQKRSRRESTTNSLHTKRARASTFHAVANQMPPLMPQVRPRARARAQKGKRKKGEKRGKRKLGEDDDTRAMKRCTNKRGSTFGPLWRRGREREREREKTARYILFSLFRLSTSFRFPAIIWTTLITILYAKFPCISMFNEQRRQALFRETRKH